MTSLAEGRDKEKVLFLYLALCQLNILMDIG
jgi:hypothetical protein